MNTSYSLMKIAYKAFIIPASTATPLRRRLHMKDSEQKTTRIIITNIITSLVARECLLRRAS